MIFLNHNDDVIRLWDGIGIRCQENTDSHSDDRKATVPKYFEKPPIRPGEIDSSAGRQEKSRRNPGAKCGQNVFYDVHLLLTGASLEETNAIPLSEAGREYLPGARVGVAWDFAVNMSSLIFSLGDNCWGFGMKMIVFCLLQLMAEGR